MTSIVAVKGSTWYPILSWIEPKNAQTMSAATRAPPITSIKIARERSNDAPTAAMPILSPSPLTVCPASEMKRKDASGKTGTNQASSAISCHLPFQQVDLVDVDMSLTAGDHENNRQADRRLGSGHRHHKDGEHLSQRLVGTDIPRKGDQVDVDAVEHQLNAHEHPDRVALGQGAVDA